MAINVNTLEQRILNILEDNSQKELDPAQARRQFAAALAEAIEAYVITRKTKVTGTSVSGGAVTGTGTIE